MSKRQRTTSAPAGTALLPPRSSAMERLPVVLRNTILAFLPLVDVLGRLPRVCRAWRSDMPAFAAAAESHWPLARVLTERELLTAVERKNDAASMVLVRRGSAIRAHKSRLTDHIRELQAREQVRRKLEAVTRALDDVEEWDSFVRGYTRSAILRPEGAADESATDDSDSDSEAAVSNPHDLPLFDAYLHLTSAELRRVLELVVRFDMQPTRDVHAEFTGYTVSFRGATAATVALVCREMDRLRFEMPTLDTFSGRGGAGVFLRRKISRRCVHDDLVHSLRQPDGGRGHPSIDALPADKRAELRALVARV